MNTIAVILKKFSEVNFMKRFKLITVVLFTVALSSCGHLLNQQPQDQVATSNAFTTADDASRSVVAAYAPLTATNWCCQSNGTVKDGGGYDYWIFGNVSTDNAVKGGESGGDQVYAQNIANYTVKPGNLAVDDAWDILYVGVRNANLVLDKVPGIKMDSKLQARYLAEAHFLRAYYYFLLVQTFGDVPLVLSTNVKSYDLARSAKSKVLAQIITDLKAAENDLPTKSQYSSSDIGRATKGAADAYLGKVYMYMGDFPNAETYLGKVINSGEYTLDPNYANIFTKTGANGSGTIFALQFNYDPPHTQRNPMGVVMGSRAMYGWGFNCPTQDLVDAYENGDPRLKHTVYQTGDTMRDGKIADVGNSPTGYLNRKAYVASYEAPGGFFNSANPMVLMRLGKVLLWYAEAANENGDTGNALTALNKVRKRAREGNATVLPDITVTNKDSLRQIIWHEERVEYAEEFDRFFDLVRTGRIGNVMRAYAQKYSTPKGAAFQDGKSEVMPIPPTDISLSQGKITQNKGY